MGASLGEGLLFAVCSGGRETCVVCVAVVCVCVCVGGYIRECTGWGDTTRECQLLNFKFCEQGGFCSVLYRLVSNRDQPSRRASKELATGWSLRGP